MTLIVHSISHEYRRRAAAKNAERKREGRPELPPRFSSGDQEAHVVAATTYFLRPTPEQAAFLGLDTIDADRACASVRTSAYMADHRGQRERVRLEAHRNFRYAETLEDRQTEMLAVMARSPHPADAFEHLVLSVRRGTPLDNAQRRALPGRLLDLLGAGDHHAFVAWHGDTDHEHAHIGVSRVHPETGRRVKLGGGWLLDAIGQAIAIIEFENGWSHEENSLYVADARGVISRETGIRVRDGAWRPTGERENHRVRREAREAREKERETEPTLSVGALEHERRHGTWSAERTARSVARPAIERATSWPELHGALAALGMRYERSKSGANLWVGDTRLTASTAHHTASFHKLQARLGTFEDRGDVTVAAYEPQPLSGKEHRARYTAAKAARARRMTGERQWIDVSADRARTALRAEHARIQRTINAHRWTGRDGDLDLCRAVAGAIHRDALHAIEEEGAGERRWLRECYRPTSFEHWLEHGFSDAEEERKKKARRWILLAPDARWKAPGIEVDGYEIERTAREWRYLKGGRVRFADRGNLLVIPDADDRESIRAALLLAARKWDTVAATGDRRFLQMVADLAAEQGIIVTNPELRKRIERRRAERDRDRIATSDAQRLARINVDNVLMQGRLVRKRGGRYAINDRKLVDHYLPGDLADHPVVQEKLRAEHLRQRPLLVELAKDIDRNPARFRVDRDGIRLEVDYLGSAERYGWLRDERFRDQVQQALRASEARHRADAERLRHRLHPHKETTESVPARTRDTVVPMPPAVETARPFQSGASSTEIGPARRWPIDDDPGRSR